MLQFSINFGRLRAWGKTMDSDEPKQPEADYEPPGIAWEEDVDVRVNLAAACGKVNSFSCAGTFPGS